MSSDQNVRLGAQERRQQLLDTARETFGIHGFTATSMNDIAEAAGVTKPVLYQHFESKHHLFHELLTGTADALTQRLQDAVNEASTGREKVERGFAAYVDFFADNPHHFRVLYGEGVRSDEVFSDELRTLDRAFHTFSAEHIDIDDLDQRARLVAAQSMAGQLEGAVGHWIRSDRSMPASELAALLARLAWQGLRGGGSAR